MCKVAIGINMGEKRNDEFEKIIRMQFSAIAAEPDGLSAVIIGKDNKLETWRSLANYPSVFKTIREKLGDAKFVAIHGRTATTGSKSLQNVHFFENNGLLFAHNGFVNKFHRWGYSSYNPIGFQSKTSLFGHQVEEDDDIESMDIEELSEIIASCRGCNDKLNKKGYCKKHKEHFERIAEIENFRFEGGHNPDEPSITDMDEELEKRNIHEKINEQDTTDSYEFLKSLPRPVTIEKIENHITETGFTGMGILIDKETRDIFLLVKKDCYAIGDNKTFATFYSYRPTTAIRELSYADFYGVKYIKGEKNISIRHKIYPLKQGVYHLDLVA